jgi:hypothetical protein
VAEAKTCARVAARHEEAVAKAAAAWKKGESSMHRLAVQLNTAMDVRLHGALALIDRLSLQLPRLERCVSPINCMSNSRGMWRRHSPAKCTFRAFLGHVIQSDGNFMLFFPYAVCFSGTMVNCEE